MRLFAYHMFLSLCVLTLFANVIDAVRLISEKGYRDGSHFYHQGDGGYAYHYNVETASSIYFKCVLFKSHHCRGRAILRFGGGFRPTQPHNHLPDPDFVGFRHFRQNVVEEVENARRYVAYQDIVDDARRDRRYSKNVRSKMTLRRLRSPLYRARMRRYPAIPQTLRELTQVLLGNDKLSKTVDGSQNLYAGSTTALDGTHHVAFFSPRMLNFMAQCKVLYADGTFRSRPSVPHSSQCFVLVALWRDVVIPLGWVLMERRTLPAYRAVLQMLKQLCPNLNPEVIMTDWEYPQQRAWQEAFPRAKMQGCMWHLCRAFVKKAKKLGLMKFRRAIPNILVYIRRACAISLLPQQFFQAALIILKNEARQEDILLAYLLRNFFSYVEDKWINNMYRSEWMSLFEAQHRTNNACETHNRMLRRAVGAYRPNVFVFIEAIAQLEHTADLDTHLQNDGDGARRNRRWKTVLVDDNLKALSNDLQMDIFQDRNVAIRNFVKRASHLYETAFMDHVNREAGRE